MVKFFIDKICPYFIFIIIFTYNLKQFLLGLLLSLGINAQNLTFDNLTSNQGEDKAINFNISSSSINEHNYRIISKLPPISGGTNQRREPNLLKFQTRRGDSGLWGDVMVIRGNSIGIGSSNPDEKLTVKGKIHAEEVKVDLNVPADYVFEKYFTGYSNLKPDYNFLTLEEIESFIRQNNHLPDIPSAKVIKEEGLHLKEMTNLLLQKVEELTLYTIEQEKRLNEQEKLIEELKVLIENK